MKVWKDAALHLYSMFFSSFRTKLFLSYLPIFFIPVVLLSFRFLNISQSALTDQARKNAHEIIKKDTEIIDTKLSKVQENSLSMITDQELFAVFSDSKTEGHSNVLEMDRKISTIIAKYFTYSPEVLSVQIATSYFIFGANTNALSNENSIKSTLYKQAIESNGRLVWIPTYDYTLMYDNMTLHSISNLKDRYIMSATRLLNCSYIDDWKLIQLPSNVEHPVLIINIPENFFSDNIQNSIPQSGASYCVTTPNGYIISHSNKNLIATQFEDSWLEYAVLEKSGTYSQMIDGKPAIVCFDTSKVTGWISAIYIPYEELTSGISMVIKKSFIDISIIFFLTSLLLSMLFSMQISKPINQLLIVVKKMTKGEFDSRIKTKSKDELGLLINQFNKMNERLEVMIEENYLAKIREKESEIMALNLQLNPHFIYNTLNVINWMAIEAGNEEISKATMDLCTMLELSFRNRRDLVPLYVDLNWLKSYLSIMAYRYEGKFKIEYNYDPTLHNCMVPKLFLQPFVENAIFHGFQSMDMGGIIKISATREKDNAVFIVEDNGAGIEEDRINEIMRQEKSNIGVSNVDRRIKLLFGSNFGITIKSALGIGTEVKITLPIKYDNRSS